MTEHFSQCNREGNKSDASKVQKIKEHIKYKAKENTDKIKEHQDYYEKIGINLIGIVRRTVQKELWRNYIGKNCL